MSQKSETWVIGTAADCSLVVTGATVSAHHCQLTLGGGGYLLQDLGSTNGTFVNGAQLTRGLAVPVAPGMEITLGRLVPMPWPAGPADGDRRSILIGRAPECDVQIDLPTVSWQHARIVNDHGSYVIEDLGSSNGTSIDRIDNRIRKATLEPRADVYLGSYKVPASRLLSGGRVEVGSSNFHRIAFTREKMSLGRDPASDIPLNFPMISWNHALLTRTHEGIWVEDLGSRNGTFVDGSRVQGKKLIQPGQQIGLGSYQFQLLADGALAQREYHGNLTIEAVGVTVHSNDGKLLLVNPASLTVFPSELVAVMGPSGAGKTTLIKALNGYTRPSAGKVLFNGTDLYQHPAQFRQQIGYVPQDDIMHPQLTVLEALTYTARLRTDLRPDEIKARAWKVLRQLNLEPKADSLIGSPEAKVLSGGQRKRVNIALELICDTPALFLDEPTSGLSSQDSDSIVALLKELAGQGKTILTTIHQPSLEAFKQFDDLIVVSCEAGKAPGSMVYFGPAYPDSIRFFNPSLAAPTAAQPALIPDMVLSGLQDKSVADWVRAYQTSRYKKEFVEERRGQQAAGPAQKAGKAGSFSRPMQLAQALPLIARNVAVKKQDRSQTLILLLQAPLFALLVCLVYYPLRLDGTNFVELSQKLAGVHFLLVVAAIWFGCNNAARDIVGEWIIYRRERMVNLNLPSYVFSKLIVLAAVCLLQCLLLLSIVYFGLGLRVDFPLALGILLLASMIGAGLGLCISALARTNESAVALLPVVLLPIITLGGGMRPVYLVDSSYRWVTSVVPSRWAFEANLLQEAQPGPGGWKDAGGKDALVPVPDGSDPDQAVSPRPGVKTGSLAPTPQPGRGTAQPPAEVLLGDVAELSIPHFLIEWKEGGVQHTARAYKDQFKFVSAERREAVEFRHTLTTIITVMLGMLAALIVTVHLVLKYRDRDPT